jgi:hypothetical protein
VVKEEQATDLVVQQHYQLNSLCAHGLLQTVSGGVAVFHALLVAG